MNKTGTTPKRKHFILAAMLLAVAIVLLGTRYAREKRLVPASIRLLNNAQTVWYANPVLNYTIVVDVIRPGEQRRCEIAVENGKVVSAAVKYRNASGLGWDQAHVLNEEQAYPFTIPGLYDMIRLPLRNNARQTIRVDMRGSPPFPHEIIFEPLWERGERLPETSARVLVRKFEISGED